MLACAGMSRLDPILRHSRESGNPFVSAVCGLQTASKEGTRMPALLHAQLVLALAYSESGREEEAQAAAAEVLRISPNFSLEVARQRSPIKTQR